jgi:hypothetical protein
MRVTSEKNRVRESRLPGSVRAKPNGRATRPLTRVDHPCWREHAPPHPCAQIDRVIYRDCLLDLRYNIDIALV